MPVTPPATPPLVVTKPFTVSFPDRLMEYKEPARANEVKQALTMIAAENKVKLGPLESGWIETMPMQFQLRSNLAGAEPAVTQALTAVSQLQKTIFDDARPQVDVGNGMNVPVSMGWPSITPAAQ